MQRIAARTGMTTRWRHFFLCPFRWTCFQVVRLWATRAVAQCGSRPRGRPSESLFGHGRATPMIKLRPVMTLRTDNVGALGFPNWHILLETTWRGSLSREKERKRDRLECSRYVPASRLTVVSRRFPRWRPAFEFLNRTRQSHRLTHITHTLTNTHTRAHTHTHTHTHQRGHVVVLMRRRNYCTSRALGTRYGATCKLLVYYGIMTSKGFMWF